MSKEERKLFYARFYRIPAQPTPPEFIEFANAFKQKPGFLGLVQKINLSIDEQENAKFCKESIVAAFQAVNKFLSEEEKSHTSLEVWKQLGDAIARRWISFQSFAYSEWEIRKSIREILPLFSEKKEIDSGVTLWQIPAQMIGNFLEN